jgi:hypothetical protein
LLQCWQLFDATAAALLAFAGENAAANVAANVPISSSSKFREAKAVIRVAQAETPPRPTIRTFVVWMEHVRRCWIPTREQQQIKAAGRQSRVVGAKAGAESSSAKCCCCCWGDGPGEQNLESQGNHCGACRSFRRSTALQRSISSRLRSYAAFLWRSKEQMALVSSEHYRR